MAECTRFVCAHCARAIEAWSDGNPFYLDEGGKKRYAYHPDHENLARCIANDVPHLCLGCGSKRKIDSRKPRTDCPRCKLGRLVPTVNLDGQPCPYCKIGVFHRDESFFGIS